MSKRKVNEEGEEDSSFEIFLTPMHVSGSCVWWWRVFGLNGMHDDLYVYTTANTQTGCIAVKAWQELRQEVLIFQIYLGC